MAWLVKTDRREVGRFDGFDDGARSFHSLEGVEKYTASIGWDGNGDYPAWFRPEDMIDRLEALGCGRPVPTWEQLQAACEARETEDRRFRDAMGEMARSARASIDRELAEILESRPKV